MENNIVGYYSYSEIGGGCFINLKGEQYNERFGKWSPFVITPTIDEDKGETESMLQQYIRLGMIKPITEIPKFVK